MLDVSTKSLLSWVGRKSIIISFSKLWDLKDLLYINQTLFLILRIPLVAMSHIQSLIIGFYVKSYSNNKLYTYVVYTFKYLTLTRLNPGFKNFLIPCFHEPTAEGRHNQEPTEHYQSHIDILYRNSSIKR